MQSRPRNERRNGALRTPWLGVENDPPRIGVRNWVTRDLESRADIDALMIDFYGKAMSDGVIGYLFTDVAHLDLAHHLPVIGDFWETILFSTGAYRKHGRNPLMVHAALHEISPLLPEHFHRWLELFGECVDGLFAGPRAEFAKQRAEGVSLRMIEYLEDR